MNDINNQFDCFAPPVDPPNGFVIRLFNYMTTTSNYPFSTKIAYEKQWVTEEEYNQILIKNSIEAWK